jgi:hypothetical protein
MSISRVKTWGSETLASADLNAEFDNIINNQGNVGSTRTSAVDMDGYELILDSDGDTTVHVDTDDRVDFKIQGQDLVQFDGTTASAVVGLKIVCPATGGDLAVQTSGEADAGIDFETSESEEMLTLRAVATAVNQIRITNAATGTNPVISSQGEADTGIDIENDQGEEMLVLEPVASGINHVQITNAASGNGPTISVAGGEANTPLNITTSGTGDLNLNTAGTGNIVADAGATGVIQLGNANIAWPNSDGAANTVLKTDGSATAAFAALVYAAGPAASSLLPLPRNYKSGCTLTRTDANTITISVGEWRNTGHDTNMILTSTLAKDIDTTWAAGAGGGLNATDFTAGSSDCEADTWYHVFLIENGSGTVDAGFDKSLVAANLLTDSSYTKYRRIGSVMTDTAKDILAFVQNGDDFWFTAPQQGTVSTSDLNQTDLTIAHLPKDISVRTFMSFTADNAQYIDTATIFGSGGTDITGVTAGLNDHFHMAQGLNHHSMTQPLMAVDQVVDCKFSSDSNGADIDYLVAGWCDFRGIDD